MKEEKLTIEVLAPYLPYGLKMIFQKSGRIIQISGLCIIDGSVEVNDLMEGDTYALNIWKFKPLLRPLSDLTKEIEVEGKRFIPAKVLWSISAKEEESFDLFGAIPEYWKLILNQLKQKNGYRDLQYYDVERMFKWHFDVFGLLEKNLAVDINTSK